MSEELVAVVSLPAWEYACSKMDTQTRARYAPDGTLGEVGMFEGVKIIVQDKMRTEWKSWGYVGKTLPAVFLS